ncbi:hypothetical protein [Yersinia mollaretii]|uniref:hypothetical protein n=1 Tax=Yersinia mollaretii TaxID=33060 RepID=UPI0011A4533F|nr:hypothetical protein [Yersinia mollaretii]
MANYHCDACQKLKPATLSAVSVGDHVGFCLRNKTGNGVRLTRVVGRIVKTHGNGDFSVTHRKRIYRMCMTDAIPADAPSILSYAITGVCKCDSEPNGDAHD